MNTLNEIEAFAGRLAERARLRDVLRRPRIQDGIQVSAVRGPGARSYGPEVVSRADHYREAAAAAGVDAGDALRGPLAWLERAARSVEQASDGRYLLMIEGTEVEMRATLAAGARGEIVLRFGR